MKTYKELIKHEIKKLLDNGAFHIFAGSFIVKFIGLFGSIFVVRLLTKQEYGILGYAENLYGYAYIFAGLGLANASLRYCIIAESKEEKYGVYRFITKAQTQFNVVLVGLICLVSFIYPHPTNYGNVEILIIILAVGLPFTSITSSTLNYERVAFANKRYVRFSIFVSFMSVISRVIGAGLFGLSGTVMFRVSAETLCCIILFHLVNCTYFSDVPKIEISKSLKKEIFEYSIHNLIANCAWNLFMLTDTFLIGRLLNDPNILADYKVACVIPSNMIIITSSIVTFITPYFIKNEKNKKWIRKNYIRVFWGNLCLVGGLTLFFAITARPIILLLYGKEFLNIVPLMRVLLIAHFINAGLKTINSGLLSAMGYARENMIVFLLGLIIQFVLGLIVIPRYGVMGLAVNNIFMYGMLTAVLTIVFSKKFGMLGRKDM